MAGSQTELLSLPSYERALTHYSSSQWHKRLQIWHLHFPQLQSPPLKAALPTLCSCLVLLCPHPISVLLPFAPFVFRRPSRSYRTTKVGLKINVNYFLEIDLNFGSLISTQLQDALGSYRDCIWCWPEQEPDKRIIHISSCLWYLLNNFTLHFELHCLPANFSDLAIQENQPSGYPRYANISWNIP